MLSRLRLIASMKQLDGKTVALMDIGKSRGKEFIDRLEGMIGPLLPRFDAEGKSYLTIAVGCTGGRHRSVAVAERLADWLRGAGRSVTLSHRDVDVRGGTASGSNSGKSE